MVLLLPAGVRPGVGSRQPDRRIPLLRDPASGLGLDTKIGSLMGLRLGLSEGSGRSYLRDVNRHARGFDDRTPNSQDLAVDGHNSDVFAQFLIFRVCLLPIWGNPCPTKLMPLAPESFQISHVLVLMPGRIERGEGI